MSNVYSGLDTEDYRAAFARLEADLKSLIDWFDEQNIRRLITTPETSDALAGNLEELLRRVNHLSRLADTLDSFVQAYTTTNSYDVLAARELSKLEQLDIQRQMLGVRMQGWIGSLAPLLDAWIERRKSLADHAYFLRDTARRSKYLMNEDLESLASELAIDAGGAFGKLQGNVTSQLKVPFERDGKVEPLPITVIRNLSFDPDPAVRRAAYETEIKGWESIRTTVAACLNGVKGTALTLNRRRGRASVLDTALDQNRIDKPTLDALLEAIREAFPTFRRYLRAKARKLGQEKLHWWDLFAPLGTAENHFTWQRARDFIVEKFGEFDDDLSEFAARAFDDRWIDGEPRDGKRGGAFCMEVVGVEESRILANFDGSFEQVSTLAHELGHGFHNHCQKGLEPLQRGAPMTLAETASIFCETLIAESALPQASPSEQLMILEAQLAGATQVCLDISSRFIFESAFLQRRTTSELSPDEICELMLSAQLETYGDAIAAETYHRYMWLWKPHYYHHDQNFYNFPYAFGHLFGLGLYAEYRRTGNSFVPRYKALLRETSQSDAAPLAARFGIDITQPDFWRGSLQVIAQQIERFESL